MGNQLLLQNALSYIVHEITTAQVVNIAWTLLLCSSFHTVNEVLK